MSKTKLFLILLVLPLMYQCSKVESHDLSPESVNSELMSAIESLGLREGHAQIVEFPDYVRIGHITYLKSTIVEMAMQTKLPCDSKQKSGLEKATVLAEAGHYPYTGQTIYYHIGTDLKNAHAQIESWIDDVIVELENLPNTDLNFQKMSSPVSSSANGINFYHRSEASACMVSNGPGDEGFRLIFNAGAMFPGNDQIGGEIMYNPRIFDKGEATIRRITKHEIGHTLGLNHTENGGGPVDATPCQSGTYTAIMFPSTSNSGGLMVTSVEASNLDNFNDDEKYTLEAMYPDPYTGLNASLTNITTGPFGNNYKASFDVSFTRKSYEIKAILMQNGSQVTGTQTLYRNGRYTPRFTWKNIPSTGSYTVQLTFRNFKGDVTKVINRTLNVT